MSGMTDATATNRRASLAAFLGKEWREAFRQSRFLILIAPLFIFAILNPLMIKLLPRLLGSQMAQLGTLIQAGAPEAIQSYFKNLGDISVFIFIMALMGTIAEERAAGAYLIPFSRRVERWQAVAAKFVVSIAILTVGLVGSALLARYYVGALFSVAPPLSGFVTGALLDAAYYWFALGVLLFFSSLAKRGYVAGIATLAVLMLLPACGYLPSVGRFLPHNLLGDAINVAVTGVAPAAAAATVAVAICLGILGAAGAGVILERAEL